MPLPLQVVVNQDKTSKQISMLRAEILSLQNELLEYKAVSNWSSMNIVHEIKTA